MKLLEPADNDERQFVEYFSSVCLALCALSVPESPQMISSRTVFLSFCVFGAVVYWSYNAVLVSLLAIDNFALPVKSLGDLLIKTNYHLIVPKDTSYEAYFTDATKSRTDPITERTYEY